MKYSLFLDDIRNPPPDRHDWNIARDFNEAVKLVQEHGCPEFISFDHDLGLEKNGYDFAKWLVDQLLDKKIKMPRNFEFCVHSMNPVGARNITLLMDRFIMEWPGDKETLDKEA